ncbi:MAG: hypothetical protein QOJ89_4779 [bacterium]|jgi:hypothetical protein
MIAQFSDEDEVGRYVGAMRDQLAAGALDEHAAAAARAIGRGAADPATAVLAALPQDDAGPASSGEGEIRSPFFSRNPAVSLLQTSLEDEARKSGAVDRPKHLGLFTHIVGFVESILHPERFGPHDSDWVSRVAEATLDRLAKGNHPFNPKPAEYEISEDDARIVIVGDWGSGLPRARAVAELMALEVADALAAGRPAHVIHLGDVYYSGDRVEYERRVLADGLWPVSAEQAALGATSWSLNGNHDMYSGGWGYFDTLLGEERFANQRSPDGEPTSFFRIKTPSWDLVGLDTSWDPEVLSLGQKGVLADPQATVLGGWAAESDRRLMLLSHHQLVSSYDLGDLGTVLPHRLAPLLDAKRIDAWLWGHEHRCMGFDAVHGIEFLRCIGHGGIPVPATAEDAKIPPPGAWQEFGSFEENDARWNSFGFAVLDFDGPRVGVRYRNDEGTQTRVERID